MQDQMASLAPAGSGPEAAATPDQAISNSTESDKQVVSSILPTTDTAPTVITGPPATATPSEKTTNPAPETAERPKHQIPKARAIAPEQIGIKILYSPENSTKHQKIEVDIVAVHGIGADPDWTWIASGESKVTEGGAETKKIRTNWLESPDMLPKAIPKARIMRYGYESHWFGETAVKQRLATVANDLLFWLEQARRGCQYRPIIFIAHCFGGLVTQKAFNLAKANGGNYKDIAASTTGIVFMGTPHRGTGSVTSQTLLYTVIAAEVEREDYVLRNLSGDNETLVDVVSEFAELANADTVRLNIMCFFEQKSTAVGRIVGDASMKEFVVDEQSASLTGHRSLGLGLDHFNMNKFLKPNDGHFIKVKSVIQDMVAASAGIMAARGHQIGPKKKNPAASDVIALPSTQPMAEYRPLSRPPYPADPRFIPHENILERIGEKFGNHPRVALYGSSGNGKTRIAIEYAYKYAAENLGANVLWVDARTTEQFENAYKAIGTKLLIRGIKDPKKDALDLVYKCLSQKSDWLMVLDGADDQVMFHKNRTTSSKPDGSGKQKRKTLLGYVPKSNGLVLITSRSHQLASSMVGQEADGEIEIPPLTTEESLSLLRKTLSEDFCDDEGALTLVEALHRSPTAINQATAYILTQGTEMSISDYLAALKSQTLQISDEDGIAVKASEINSPESAAVAAWQILYEFIRQKHHESAQLLAIISVLELQRIPVSLLDKTSKDKKQVKAAISILVQFGMVTFFTSQKSISATRLVQLCTKAWLTQRNEKAWAEDRALWLVKETFPVPEDEEYDTCDQACDQLHPYANVVLKFQPSSIESKLNLATLLFNTAGYSKYLGKYDDARRSLEDALKLREENLGKDDEQLQEIKKALEALSEAQSQNGAGSQSTKDGASVSTGKKGSVRATDLVRNAKLPRALTKVQSLLQLAQQSLAQEHHQEAEAHSKEGLAECEKTLGQDHIDTLKMADCLAIAYQSQGRGDEALASHIRVLDWCRATYGPSHIDTLRQTYNLALTYDLQGQFDTAIPLYEEALEGIKALVGPDSPEVLRILSSLATIYDILGDSATAEPLFQTALTGQQQALGPEHPETLLTMHNLALLAQSRNDLATAETYLLHVLSGQEQVLGPEHSATLRTASNLALNFQLQRKYEQAEPLFNLTLEGQRARLGEEHPDTLWTRFMFGEFLEEVGRMGEAQVQFKLALEGREKRLGEGHPDTIMVRRKLDSLGEGLEVVRGPESVAA